MIYCFLTGTSFLASSAAFAVQGDLVAGLIEETKLCRLIVSPPFTGGHLLTFIHTPLLAGGILIGNVLGYTES